MITAASGAVPFAVASAGDGCHVSSVTQRLGGRLVLSRAAVPAAVEQYRRLAATLHHAQEQPGFRTIMITSALPAEGKTLTAANLAVTLSESYRRRVLVLDADLRRPSMHNIFNLPSVDGLNDILTAPEDAPPRACAFRVSERLTVIPAGRPTADPMGALASSAMRRLLASVPPDFDWVLVDTPPVGLLPDANLLARLADAVILVVSAGKVSYKLVQRAADAVGRERIVGVVLNRATDVLLSSGYGYGGYYGVKSR